MITIMSQRSWLNEVVLSEVVRSCVWVRLSVGPFKEKVLSGDYSILAMAAMFENGWMVSVSCRVYPRKTRIFVAVSL